MKKNDLEKKNKKIKKKKKTKKKIEKKNEKEKKLLANALFKIKDLKAKVVALDEKKKKKKFGN